MRRVVALLVLAVLPLGCGGQGNDAQKVLAETADNLSEIHSGNLRLRLVVSPREGTKGRIGFELQGPFALRAGRLPIARVAYTQIAGAKEATATFISTGANAYAAVNGKVYELPPAAVNSVRQAAAGLGGSNGLGSFDVGSWVKDPAVEGGDDDTDHVSAKLEVVNAANGLLALLRGLGNDAPVIEGAEADRLRDAVESSSFDVWSGRDDRLLRRLLMQATLGLDVPQSLRRVLGDVVGAKVEFELAVDNPNEPVTVAPPKNPLPYSELPGGS